MKGGFGKCVAVLDCLAESSEDLVFIKVPRSGITPSFWVGLMIWDRETRLPYLYRSQTSQKCSWYVIVKYMTDRNEITLFYKYEGVL